MVRFLHLFKLVKELLDYVVYISCNRLEQPLKRSVQRDILKNTIDQNGIINNVQAIHRKAGKGKQRNQKQREPTNTLNNKMADLGFTVAITNLKVNDLNTSVKTDFQTTYTN